MKFYDAMIEAARVATAATDAAMGALEARTAVDEDDLNPVLMTELSVAFRGLQIGGLTWKCSVLRHRGGVAAEEKEYGADLLMQVALDTPQQKYSKGVFVQAKKVTPGRAMAPKAHRELIQQCNTMLSHTPSAFVFNYSTIGVRCASASKIAGSAQRNLHAACDMTAYHFYRDLFLCTIGDPSWKAPRSATLRAAGTRGVDVIRLVGEGNLDMDETPSVDVPPRPRDRD